LSVNRHGGNYDDWVDLLNSDTYIEDAKWLTKFALENNLSGYLINRVAPQNVSARF